MKRIAPAAARNQEAILELLRQELPSAGVVLEIASGTGQHAAFFAGAFPSVTWQPTDIDPQALASIAAYRFELGLPNLAPPQPLDAANPAWPLDSADAVVCINMLHIAPWAACVGLMKGAARILPQQAPLVIYGPFTIDGELFSEGNRAFDEQLRRENAEWGLRELRDVQREAEERGLALQRFARLPANNHALVFRRV